ncbi:hypothetical protein BLNAU_3152 [Blattamonas nauphoetae]|uniref:Uncharacterized protein n=1 Tax=Blattamonas nauphoetae TaxID=2049346 RepID=A0ABQ9YDE5_9EUKA|nr:hypothetical protein BLNAU_3152 [Blattamonas nauphoetae]
MKRSAVAFSTQKALPLHPPTRPFIAPVSSPFATLSALPVRTADHLTLGTADTNTLPPPSHDVDEAVHFNSVAGVVKLDSLNTMIHRVVRMEWTNETPTHTHSVFWVRVEGEEGRERECRDKLTARRELDGRVCAKDGEVSMWQLWGSGLKVTRVPKSSHSVESHRFLFMTFSAEYSPFLTWKENDLITVDSAAPVLISLISMVRDGYYFDEELLSKSSTFLSSTKQRINRVTDMNDFLKAIGLGSPDPAAVFVDSITMLLSSPHPSIFRDALSSLSHILMWCSTSNRLALVSSKVIPRILSTPHLRNLSVIDNRGVTDAIRVIFGQAVWLSSVDTNQSLSTKSKTDPESIRDVVQHEVLIPIVPSLVQISRNRHLLSWNKEYKQIFHLLTDIFNVGTFHQPTLDFICSSRIPMAYQSLLSKVRHEETHQGIIWLIFSYISRWKENGTQTWRRGRILLQALEQEGFHERLEQTLLHNKSTRDGRYLRTNSFKIMHRLGMNCPNP